MLRFEQFSLDLVRGRIRNGDAELQLRPKSLEVLRFLVDNAGRLVTKDEIIGAVWRDVFVTEDSLSRCISEIRAALGEAGQRIIETVPKRGYIFAVSVRRDETNSLATVNGPVEIPTTDRASLAVLPFVNLSGDPCQDYLSDGITEDIINGLSQFSELSVIARNSSFTYKGRAVDVREIGRELGVRYVVEGSARRFDDRIRITVQLVDAPTRIRRWADRFDRALGDVFAVQDEITQAIVRIVVAHVGTAEEQRAAHKSPSSWTAYDLLMQGDHAWRALEQSWITRHLHEAHQFYEKAYEADADSAVVCARLSLSFMRVHADPASPNVGDPDALKRGYEMAERAVSLDPNLPFARTRLAWALFWMRRLDDALREFEKAVTLNPNFSDVHFPAVLNFAGEPSRALALLRFMVRLDPFHPAQLHALQGHALYLMQEYENALLPLNECIRRGPHGVLGHIWLAAALTQLGRVREARQVVSELRARLPHLTLSRWRIFELYRDPVITRQMLADLHTAGLE